VEGDIKKLDAGAKTAVVKTADGTEHTFRFAKSTTVHGAEEAGTGAKDAFHGLKEGSSAMSPYITRRAARQRLPTKSTTSERMV
jgi:hypothetical protein